MSVKSTLHFLFACLITWMSMPLSSFATTESELKSKIANYKNLSDKVTKLCINGEDKDTVTFDMGKGEKYNCDQMIIIVARLYQEISEETQDLKDELTCQAIPGTLGAAAADLAHASADASSKVAVCKPNAQKPAECVKDFVCMAFGVPPVSAILKSAKAGLDAVGTKSATIDSLNKCASKGDQCIINALKGIFDSLFSTVEGIWDLGKMAFKSMFGSSEEATSNKLLAGQTADEGFLSRMRKDPVGTISDMATGMYNSIKDAAINHYGCEEWSGAPYVSECLQPMKSWDCGSCQQKGQVICGVLGYAGGEIITAFLTGGAVSAVKNVGLGAVKLGGAAGAKIGTLTAELFPKAAKGLDATAETVKGLAKSAATGTAKGAAKISNATVKSFEALSKSSATKAILAKAKTITTKIGETAKSGSLAGKGSVALSKVFTIPLSGVKVYLKAVEKAFEAGMSAGDKVAAKLGATGANAGKVADAADVAKTASAATDGSSGTKISEAKADAPPAQAASTPEAPKVDAPSETKQVAQQPTQQQQAKPTVTDAQREAQAAQQRAQANRTPIIEERDDKVILNYVQNKTTTPPSTPTVPKTVDIDPASIPDTFLNVKGIDGEDAFGRVVGTTTDGKLIVEAGNGAGLVRTTVNAEETTALAADQAKYAKAMFKRADENGTVAVSASSTNRTELINAQQVNVSSALDAMAAKRGVKLPDYPSSPAPLNKVETPNLPRPAASPVSNPVQEYKIPDFEKPIPSSSPSSVTARPEIINAQQVNVSSALDAMAAKRGVKLPDYPSSPAPLRQTEVPSLPRPAASPVSNPVQEYKIPNFERPISQSPKSSSSALVSRESGILPPARSELNNVKTFQTSELEAEALKRGIKLPDYESSPVPLRQVEAPSLPRPASPVSHPVEKYNVSDLDDFIANGGKRAETPTVRSVTEPNPVGPSLRDKENLGAGLGIDTEEALEAIKFRPPGRATDTTSGLRSALDKDGTSFVKNLDGDAVLSFDRGASEINITDLRRGIAFPPGSKYIDEASQKAIESFQDLIAARGGKDKLLNSMKEGAEKDLFKQYADLTEKYPKSAKRPPIPTVIEAPKPSAALTATPASRSTALAEIPKGPKPASALADAPRPKVTEAPTVKVEAPIEPRTKAQVEQATLDANREAYELGQKIKSGALSPVEEQAALAQIKKLAQDSLRGADRKVLDDASFKWRDDPFGAARREEAERLVQQAKAAEATRPKSALELADQRSSEMNRGRSTLDRPSNTDLYGSVRKEAEDLEFGRGVKLEVPRYDASVLKDGLKDLLPPNYLGNPANAADVERLNVIFSQRASSQFINQDDLKRMHRLLSQKEGSFVNGANAATTDVRRYVVEQIETRLKITDPNCCQNSLTSRFSNEQAEIKAAADKKVAEAAYDRRIELESRASANLWNLNSTTVVATPRKALVRDVAREEMVGTKNGFSYKQVTASPDTNAGMLRSISQNVGMDIERQGKIVFNAPFSEDGVKKTLQTALGSDANQVNPQMLRRMLTLDPSDVSLTEFAEAEKYLKSIDSAGGYNKVRQGLPPDQQKMLDYLQERLPLYRDYRSGLRVKP